VSKVFAEAQRVPVTKLKHQRSQGEGPDLTSYRFRMLAAPAGRATTGDDGYVVRS
jgi:hypothetical protein